MDVKQCQYETANALNLPPKDVAYITAGLLEEYDQAIPANTADGDVRGDKNLREEGGLRTKWGTYGNSLVFTPDPNGKIYWKQENKDTVQYGFGAKEVRSIDRNLVTYIHKTETSPDGITSYFIGNYKSQELASKSDFVNNVKKIFNEKEPFLKLIIFLAVAAIGALLWFFLDKVFNQKGEGLASPGFVRGWITLLICFATIAFGIGIVTTALRMPKKEEAFRYSREVFSSFTAVLATIVGFYFGSETRRIDPNAGADSMAAIASADADAAAKTAKDAQELHKAKKDLATTDAETLKKVEAEVAEARKALDSAPDKEQLKAKLNAANQNLTIAKDKSAKSKEAAALPTASIEQKAIATTDEATLKKVEAEVAEAQKALDSAPDKEQLKVKLNAANQNLTEATSKALESKKAAELASATADDKVEASKKAATKAADARDTLKTLKEK